MENIFLSVLNMSLTGGFVIMAVCLARLPLKKAPKGISYALWAVVGFRLVFPFSIRSVFSLLPFKSVPIPGDIAMQAVPRIDSGIARVDNAVSAILPAAAPTAGMNPLQGLIAAGTCIWFFGVAAMLVYSLVSIVLLKRRLRSSMLAGDNIYEADNLKTPFVIGFFKPDIYIPAGLSGEERRYIVLHEQTHIRRQDHAVKMFAYLVLCLHWFNPLAWLGFILMGADMEMSCDERVMKELGEDIKSAYSLSLVRVAAGRKILNGSPLAFGEGGMKERIKNVLNFKKPSRVMIIASVTLVAVLIAGFAVNRTVKEDPVSPALVPASGTYYLENPTEKQKWERMISVTLYDDGRVRLGTPPISSYGLPDCYSTITNDELWIHASITAGIEEEAFGVKNEEVIARFTIVDDKTLVFQSATVLLFADGGARYVRRENPTSEASGEQRPMALDDVGEVLSDPINLPDFKPENPTGVYDGEVDGKVYGGIFNSAILKQYGDSQEGFLVYAPTIHGVYEESGRMRAFVTVHYEHYRLKGKTLTGETGGVIPAAITFSREERSGSWVMEEYTEIGSSPDYPDGAYFGDSIRKLCVLPVSGKEITGLAQKIINDYSDHTTRSQRLRESLIEHLLQYGQTDVFLQKPDGSLVKLT